LDVNNLYAYDSLHVQIGSSMEDVGDFLGRLENKIIALEHDLDNKANKSDIPSTPTP